jgi:S1 RNA binding domain
VAEAAAELSSDGRGAGRSGRGVEPYNEAMPFIEFVARHAVGSEVEATIERFSSHGAYVMVGDARAYVPLRNLADPAPRSAKEVLKVGEVRRFLVQSIDPPRRGIDLGLPGVIEVAASGPADVAAIAEETPELADAAAAVAASAGAPAAKAKAAGAKKPATRKSTATKKAAAAKKAAPKKAAPKKAAAKKAAAKKTAAPDESAAAKKNAAKKAAPKKAPTKKKAAAKKAAAPEKAAAKKAAPRKSATKKASGVRSANGAASAPTDADAEASTPAPEVVVPLSADADGGSRSDEATG